jgi:hypothetical protein
LALAHELLARYAALLPQIQANLFDHYEPYREADSASELPERSEPFPTVERAEDVWPHVTEEWVSIDPLRGSPEDGPTIEIAYRVAWDKEHTVKARIHDRQVGEFERRASFMRRV